MGDDLGHAIMEMLLEGEAPKELTSGGSEPSRRASLGGGTAAGPLPTGTKVRIKIGVTPKYGWGHAEPEMAGEIVGYTEDQDVLVDWPTQKQWRGLPSQVEPV